MSYYGHSQPPDDRQPHRWHDYDPVDLDIENDHRFDIQRQDTLRTFESRDHLIDEASSRRRESYLADYEPSTIVMHPMQRTSSRASTLIDSSPVPPRPSETPITGGGPSNVGGMRYDEKGAQPAVHEIEHSLLYIAQSKKYQPPWFLLGPSVAVLLLTAGLATIMVLWIMSHRLPLQSDGVIFVREGVENEPDRLYTEPTLGLISLRFNAETSHSTGLSFSTIISTLAGASIYPYMALIAYSLATDWLILQAKVAECPSVAQKEQLPTPMQYALLLQLCSGQSLGAVWDTLRHIFNNRGSRASVPALLKKAVTWLIILLMVNAAITWTDFWLHETVKVVQIVNVEPQPVMRSYGMELNTTLCPELQGTQAPPCLVTIHEDMGDLDFGARLNIEALQAKNVALHWTEATLAEDEDEDDKSGRLEEAFRAGRNSYRFTPPPPPNGETLVFAAASDVATAQMFHIPTIGVKSQCQIITPSCRHDAASFDCSNVGHPRIYSNPDYELRTRAQLTQSTNQSAFSLATDSEPVNPLPVEVLVAYEGLNTTSLDDTGFEALQQGTDGSIYSIAICNMSIYDLDVAYFNGTFELRENKTLASPDLAYQLSGPLMAGKVARSLALAMTPFTGKMDSQRFIVELEHSLSYILLKEASVLLAPVAVPVLQFENILASQYPVVALYFYFALLYSYALVAIFLFVWAWSTSSDSITYDCPLTGKRVQIPAANLAQKVLMDPTRLIAVHLSAGQTHAHHSTLASVATMLAHAHPAALDDGSKQEKKTPTAHNIPADRGVSTGIQKLALNRQAVFRTTATDLLGLFDEPVHQERLVVGLESGGRGFGVWPLSQAAGAVGEPVRNNKRESLVHASKPFHHSSPHHRHDRDSDFSPAE